MCPGSECVVASSGKFDSWLYFWKCLQEVSVPWLLLATGRADEPSENVFRKWVCSGFFWQAGWLMRLPLKMCPESECILVSSGKLDEAPSENVSREWVSSGFFWLADEPSQNVFREWVCSSPGKLDGDEALSENVSRLWVCSGFFWQAGWLMRLLLKMCPGSECVLASSDKLNSWWGSFQKRV